MFEKVKMKFENPTTDNKVPWVRDNIFWNLLVEEVIKGYLYLNRNTLGKPFFSNNSNFY